MKDIELSSRDTDRKLLIALSSSAFAAFVGFVLPTPFDAPGVRLLDALITLGLGGLFWGVFHLLEPERYGRKWDNRTIQRMRARRPARSQTGSHWRLARTVDGGRYPASHM